MAVRRRALREGVGEKFLGGLAEELAGERKHDDIVGARMHEHVKAIGVARELLQAVGMEHLVGIDVERDGNSSLPRRTRDYSLVDEVLVPRVQAVEHAECARRTREHSPVERFICNVKRHTQSRLNESP